LGENFNGADDFIRLKIRKTRKAFTPLCKTGWKIGARRECLNVLRMPDEILNTKIGVWQRRRAKLSVRSPKPRAVVEKTISIDEDASHRRRFFRFGRVVFFRSQDLVVVEDFINGAAKRSEIWTISPFASRPPTKKSSIFAINFANYRRKLSQSERIAQRENGKLWVTFQTRFPNISPSKHDTV
jgi:hypothetical protein